MKNKYFIHESAYIDQPVHIGEGTKIWHFCHVMKDASIGQNCTLGQNVYIANKVKIGNNVKIQNNVSIYEGVKLEDFVFSCLSFIGYLYDFILISFRVSNIYI